MTHSEVNSIESIILAFTPINQSINQSIDQSINQGFLSVIIIVLDILTNYHPCSHVQTKSHIFWGQACNYGIRNVSIFYNFLAS